MPSIDAMQLEVMNKGDFRFFCKGQLCEAREKVKTKMEDTAQTVSTETHQRFQKAWVM